MSRQLVDMIESMHRWFGWLVSLLLCAGLAGEEKPASAPAALPAAAGHRVDFVKEIKPLFEASCIQCHARGKSKGGLSLETRQSFLKGGDSGPAALPGRGGDSLVVRLVAGLDPDNQMPKKGKKWTPQQIGLLRAWIDQGVRWDAGITFARPEPANLVPRQPKLPPGKELHPVDRIVAGYFASKGTTEPGVVSDRVFVRRAYLDLIGLLPTSEQLQSFLADPSADKRGRLVRQLLADRRGYSDHWLAFWNDLLRNDYRGAGFIDGGRRQISGWLYAALINNEPYDRFVAELVNPTKACEGFSRGIIWRGTVNASMLPPMQAAQNTSQVFMGVNLKCASCHDSFINDWTLADSYGMAAVFSDAPLEMVRCDQPTGQTAGPRFLYPRIGQIDPKLPRAERLGRFSELLTGRENGRLSRTIVNRLWARLLGRGLVEPLDDMDRPAWDADLLDWLAEDLVARHYDLKRTIEMILTSRAYQLPSVEGPANEKQYVFRGPLVRRLSAEQFCDAISSFSGDFARLPDTLDIDFTTGNLIGPITMPAWIWTDEPLELGQQQADFQWEQKQAQEQRKKAEEKAKPADKQASDQAAPKKDDVKDDGDDEDDDDDAAKKKKLQDEPPEHLPRHKVVFRKSFTLVEAPREAYAAAAASQSFSLIVNGKRAKSALSDGQRRGRVAIYDVGKRLVAGRNTIVFDVASHTEKPLTDVEKQQYPLSRNHLNSVSGVSFYLRAKLADERTMELISDPSWRVMRAPEGRWKQSEYDDGEWLNVIVLAQGVAPVDEGPALAPITRNDFANEAIDFGPPMRSAATTAAQPGGIRASMLASDPLMTALDRPSREQVMTSRDSAATTLQELELTHGKTLDERLARAAHRLFDDASKDPRAWVTKFYEQAMGRAPGEQEMSIALEMLGRPVIENGIADFMWAVAMTPEFQFIE